MIRRGLVLVAAALMLALAGHIAEAQSAEQTVSVRVTASDTPKPTKSPKPTKPPKTNGGGGLGSNVLGNVTGNGGGGGGPIPRTGRDIAILAMIGVALVATGTGLIVVTRRRRPA